jgi:protein involved in polysaccharide export with SLBB domain
LAASLVPVAAAADGYRLGVQDKVRIRVLEWLAAQDTLHEWTPLNGEFMVGPSGTISLPLVGEVPAAGARTDELAQAISARLKERVGL